MNAIGKKKVGKTAPPSHDEPNAADQLRTMRRMNTPIPPKPPTRQEVVDWLAYETQELTSRRDGEILPAIALMVAAHPVIADGDEDLAGRITENIKLAKDLIGEAATEHTRHKKPYREAGLAVDAWKNNFEATVARALAPLEAIARDYALRKHNRERAEREAVAARAAEAARIAREEAAVAARENMWATEAMARAEEADRAASAAARTQRAASAAPSLSTRGDYGAKSGLTRRWKWALTDITQVPAAYLLLNEPAVRVAAKPRDPQTNRPTAVIPGIEWVEDLDFAVR